RRWSLRSSLATAAAVCGMSSLRRVVVSCRAEETGSRDGRAPAQPLGGGGPPPIAAGPREGQAELAGLRLALEESGKRRIVQVNDAEHAGQHSVGSLDGRLERELLLAGGGRLGACGWLAEGGRVPRDFEEPLGLR